MGSYVERGANSVSVFLLLLALKVRYPERMTMLRGRHEVRAIRHKKVYGLYEEVLKMYGNINVYTYITEVFDYLQIAAIVDNKIFCVYGGLSPHLKTLSDIESFNRSEGLPEDGLGLMRDMIYS